MAFVEVAYQYSVSSDRILDKEAKWRGRVAGMSLATVMSELRGLHRGATNISITKIEWLQEGAPGDAGAAMERRAEPGRDGMSRGAPTG